MSYFITNSGQRIDLSDFKAKDVCLHDIAHHLTNVKRYSGALPFNKPYSVAQHSIVLALFAHNTYKSRDLAKYMLMHDASEYILGDMNKHIKHFLPDYLALENKVQTIILEKYNIQCPIEFTEISKLLDTNILLNEANACFPKQYYYHFTDQILNVSPLDGIEIEIPSEEVIYNLFLTLCKYLDIHDKEQVNCDNLECYEHE